MNTFNQIINKFLDGAKSGIEGSDENEHAKLVINGDFLIWITAERTYLVAVRLAEKVIVKTISWEVLSKAPGINYLNKRAKATGTVAIRLELPALDNSEIDRKYNNMKELTKKHIEELLLNEGHGVITPKMGNNEFRQYMKKIKDDKQMRTDRDSLQIPLRVLAILEQEQITKTHILMNDDYTNFFNITSRARIVLTKLDMYIQVLITLPEIISSPKENIPGPDEQPGGGDSGL